MDKLKLEKHVEDGWSQKDISKFYNKSIGSIRHWLNKYGLKTKNIESNKIKRVEELKKVIKESYSLAQVCKKLGRASGGNGFQNLKTDIEENNIDISHFESQHYIKNFIKLKDYEILVYNRNNGKREKTSTLKRSLINKGINPNKCSLCPQTNTWNGEELVLQIDHIDGDRVNNVIDNLRFLCPNCHSQTKTFSRK